MRAPADILASLDPDAPDPLVAMVGRRFPLAMCPPLQEQVSMPLSTDDMVSGGGSGGRKWRVAMSKPTCMKGVTASRTCPPPAPSQARYPSLLAAPT